MTLRTVMLVSVPFLAAWGCGGSGRAKAVPAPMATSTSVRPPTAPDPSDRVEPERASTSLSLAWSDSGMAVATCGHEERARRTLVTTDGAQFPIATDYPQAGFRAYRRGLPRWQPGADVVALPDDHGVVLWDAKQRTMVRRLPHGGGTEAPTVTWSPSGRALATTVPLTVREMGRVSLPLQVWDVAAGSSQAVALPHGEVVSWHPNGKAIASGQGTISSLHAPPVFGDEVTVTTLGGGRRSLPGHTPVFDPTGRHLAVAAGLYLDGEMGARTTIYDANTWKERAQVPGHRPQWSDDGNVLMTQAEEALVVTSAGGRETARLPAAGGNWPLATLSPDGTRVAIRGNDELTIWHVATKGPTPYATFNDGLPVWITRDVVAAEGGYPEGVTVISVKDGATAHATATLADGICRVHFASTDGTEGPTAWARVFGREAASSPPAPPPAPATAPPSTATSRVTLSHGESPTGVVDVDVSWSGDEGAFVALCPGQKRRTLVDVAARRMHPLPPAAGVSQPPSWNRMSSHVALRTPTGMVVVERASGTTTASLPTPGATEAEAFWGPPSNPTLAVSWIADPERDGANVVLLDPTTGTVETTIEVPPAKYGAEVRWKPDGTRLLTLPGHDTYMSDRRSTLRVWDAGSGRQTSAFSPKEEKDSVQAPRLTAWHPTDDVIFTSTGSGGMFNMWAHAADAVRLWSGSGRSLGSLPGHSWSVNGGLLAVVAGHGYRSLTAPSTTFYDLSTRRRLTTVLGSVAAIDDQGRWAITTVSPYSNHNARTSEPVVHWLWRLPDGAPLRRLALGQDSAPNSVRLIADRKLAAWPVSYDHRGKDRPSAFALWDLTTGRRLFERRFDSVVGLFGHTWLAEGRVLQLSYMDGRQRFIDVNDGRWVDVVATGERCDITVLDEDGPTTLAALHRLLGL